MLGAVLAAQQLTIPAWSWLFLALVLIVVVVVLSVGVRRMSGGQAVRSSRRGSQGLTTEQQAFQDEMRLMLEARLREREEAGPPPVTAGDDGGASPG